MRRILVLLSTYNGSAFLDEQLSSLFSQKNVEVEVLIRDDGSKDDSLTVIRKYINENRLCYYTGENIGSRKSFFDLIQQAPMNYDYYAFCDQDDYWEEEKLDVAVKKLEAMNDDIPALYYSGQKITDRDLNIIYNHSISDRRSHYANYIFNQMAGCTAVFNKSLMKKLKQYRPSGICDHDVWCYRVCVALSGNIYVDSNGYILYRQHGKNAIGLDNSLYGKMKRARNYIFESNIRQSTHELIAAYETEISQEWLSFFKILISENHPLKSKMDLIFFKGIRFDSIKLRVLFVVKVLLGKI